jgi:Rho GTPase-activating protein 1
MKLSSNGNGHGQEREQDNIKDIMAWLIFQAGIDFETRPMVVFNASALPDPKQIDYDVLLMRITAYLALYVESNYTIIFFAAPALRSAQHTPSWVWKVYRSLGRTYRKNPKRLYIFVVLVQECVPADILDCNFNYQLVH